eukprot:5881161-Prymnesium_polylepis.1
MTACLLEANRLRGKARGHNGCGGDHGSILAIVRLESRPFNAHGTCFGCGVGSGMWEPNQGVDGGGRGRGRE